MVSKILKFSPLIFILFTTFSFASVVSASISFSGGGTLPITYIPAYRGPITFDIDFTSTRVYFSDGYLILNNLEGFNLIGFSCETETANTTITKISLSEIELTINAPTGTVSTTKIYSPNIAKPSDVLGSTSWSYNIFTKTITINVQHQSPADLKIIWGASDIMIDSIAQGAIIQGITTYFISSVGTIPFYGIIFFGITILAYIWTQSLEYIAVIWILIGGALEIFIPGPILSIGKIMMTLGIFLILIKIILRKSDYG